MYSLSWEKRFMKGCMHNTAISAPIKPLRRGAGCSMANVSSDGLIITALFLVHAHRHQLWWTIKLQYLT